MLNLDILYEDNHLIVAVKKPGILSQADGSNKPDMLTLLKTYIKEKYQKPGNVYLGLVHRLDCPVGGIMVFAKTSKSAKRLNEQIKNNQMHKKYYAIIEGYLENKSGKLVDKLEKTNNQKVLLNTKNGKEAILEYNVICEKDNYSLVDINLVTGRYHQIRVQFASRNHPLYGDGLYGKNNGEDIALFAYELSFIHPVTKEVLKFNQKPIGKFWQKYLQ